MTLMNTINFDELKSKIQACDRNQIDQKIMLCLSSIRPALAFAIYQYLMMNALELAYIPAIRVLFKFGLNDEGLPLGLNKDGGLEPFKEAYTKDSLDKNHSQAFDFINKAQDATLLAWLYKEKEHLYALAKYEVGKQALKYSNYKLAKLLARHGHVLLINNAFMLDLLICSKGHKIIYRVPELLHFMPQDVLNCIFNISDQSYVLIEYLASTEYGRKLLYLNDHQLTKSFLPHGLALHAECKDFGWVPIFLKLLHSEEGFDLLCFDNFFWLRHLSDEYFDEIFYNLLEVKDFDIVQFANDHPMFLLMLALFPGGRAWLGLPEGAADDPLLQYLNTTISAGYFTDQSIALWLASCYKGMLLLETYYIESLMLASGVKSKLAYAGDKGKQLLVKAAKNGCQSDFTSIFSMFCFYERKEKTASPDAVINNDLK